MWEWPINIRRQLATTELLEHHFCSPYPRGFEIGIIPRKDSYTLSLSSFPRHILSKINSTPGMVKSSLTPLESWPYRFPSKAWLGSCPSLWRTAARTNPSAYPSSLPANITTAWNSIPSMSEPLETWRAPQFLPYLMVTGLRPIIELVYNTPIACVELLTTRSKSFDVHHIHHVNRTRQGQAGAPNR